MKQSAKQVAVSLLPMLLGVMAFFIIVGPRALNPMNIAWLDNGDPATHYLGWWFFRQSAWTFPIGLNPSYGLELGNGLIYSDSNPLLAFLFKPFSALLPETFQYFGIWFLACFILQAWFAWKLVGLITHHVTLRALSTALFLFLPPMIERMSHHLSLAGHFLILAALYLALRPEQNWRRLGWGALLAACALIHAYFLAMVALIWLADLTAQYFKSKLKTASVALEFALLFSLVSFCCWQAGYFSVDSDGMSSSGFGLYRTNLLSLINPQAWSYVLKDIPSSPGDGEGYVYLGLGLIFLAICGLLGLLQSRTGFREVVSRRPVLLVALAGLAIFAISNHIAIGSFELAYPLPEAVVSIANIFRASGRMFWPVYYSIILAIIFLVIRANKPGAAVCLVSLALAIQVADTRVGWSIIRKTLMVEPSSQCATPFIAPFWKNAAEQYRKVRWILPQNLSPQWRDVAFFAGSHHMQTDAVYLGRMSVKQWEKASQRIRKSLASGQYDADSLYLIDSKVVLEAATTANSQTDLFTKIDGFTVLAPGWKQCTSCLRVAEDQTPQQFFPELEIGRTVQFGNGGSGHLFLTRGWSEAEVWGIWSDGDDAEIAFRMPDSARTLRIETLAFLPPGAEHQRVVINANGVEAMTVMLDKADTNVIELKLTPAIQHAIKDKGLLRLNLQFADAISPMQAGMSSDSRKLAFGLKAITVN